MRDWLQGYYFYDLNAKVNHKFSDKDRLYVSAYQGDDKLILTMKIPGPIMVKQRLIVQVHS